MEESEIVMTTVVEEEASAPRLEGRCSTSMAPKAREDYKIDPVLRTDSALSH